MAVTSLRPGTTCPASRVAVRWWFSPATAGTLRRLSVRRAGTGAAAGRVQSDPPAIDCGGGGTCGGVLPIGTAVSLDATPPPGGIVSWGRGCQSGHLVLAEDKSCTVTFGAAPLALVQSLSAGVDGVLGLRSPWSVAASPDGRHVYVLGLEGANVAVFGREATSGALHFVALERRLDGGAFSPDGIVVGPGGSQVYMLSSDGIGVFSRAASSGRLTLLEILRGGAGDTSINFVRSLVFSPNGLQAYAVTGRGLALLSRDAASGRLSVVEILRRSDGGLDLRGSVDVTVAPDGRHVYVIGSSDALTVFARDPETGHLSQVELLRHGPQTDGLDEPERMAVSPSGGEIYVLGREDSSLAMYARDRQTGRLRLVLGRRDAAEGVDGLWYPSALAVSPDGQRVYVTGRFDAAVAAFAARPRLGRLDFLGLQRDGLGGVEGLAGAIAMALSPDGRQVYVAGADINTVSVFSTVSGPLD
jgi:DNA-binding beta-propeller fold protein YncE